MKFLMMLMLISCISLNAIANDEMPADTDETSLSADSDSDSVPEPVSEDVVIDSDESEE